MSEEPEQSTERYSIRQRRRPIVYSPKHSPSKQVHSDLLLKYSVHAHKGFKEVKTSSQFDVKSAWRLSHILAKLFRTLGLNSYSKYRTIYFDDAAQSKS